MNLFIRLLRILIHAFFRPSVGFFEPSVITFRVLPHDLDFNMHMTNSRYLSIMDLGRVDLLMRVGAVGVMLKKRWQGVIGSVTLRYRRSLHLFQAYELKTQLINVDDKWFYIEHRFESKGELIAHGFVRAIFVDAAGSVPVATVLQTLNIPTSSLPLKEFLALWNEMDQAVKNYNSENTDEKT